MNSYLQTPVAVALGSALLHFLWEGALLALLLAVTLWLAGARSSLFRYTAATLTLLAMAVAFVLTFVSLAPATPPAPKLEFLIPGPPPALPLALAPALPSAAVGAQWTVLVWLAGVLALYARSLVGWLGVQHLRRTGVCSASETWHARFRELADRAGVRRTVALLESCRLHTPVVIGFLRPAVLAPLGLLTSLPAAQAELILIHELAHIRRRDYLVNLLQAAVEGLLFYHPAVWWVSSIVRAERENCCDDIVLELNGDRRSYADALLQLEEARQLAIAATSGDLSTRIRRILYGRQSRNAPEPIAAAVALALLASGLLLAGRSAHNTPTPIVKPAAPAPVPAPKLVAQAQPLPRRNPLASPAQPDPYQRWVNEDVVYVITGEEQQAFNRLMTDAERQQFIEQFWLRRDPTAGTPQNEYQEEHYRRIAYANDRFGTATLAGWRSDRGRVYIKYGPPDEKEQHLAEHPAREIWRYLKMEGAGHLLCEFVDSNGTGEFKMTIDPSAQAARRPLTDDELQVVVQQLPEGPVSLRVATDAEAAIYGRIATSARRPITFFQEATTKLVQKEFPLAPGSYRLTFLVNVPSINASGLREIEFEVK